MVVVVAGNDPHINGRETEDRTTLRLPAHQERLLRAARAANPRTVLALVSALPVRGRHVPTCPRCCGRRTAARRPAPPWPACWPATSPPPAASRRPGTRDDADLPDLLDYDVIGARADVPVLRGHAAVPVRPRPVVRVVRVRRPDGPGRGRRRCTSRSRSRTPVTSPPTRSPSSTPAPWTRRSPRPRRELLAHRRVTLAPGARGGAVLRSPACPPRVLGRGAGPVAPGAGPVRAAGRRLQRGRPAADDGHARRRAARTAPGPPTAAWRPRTSTSRAASRSSTGRRCRATR